MGEVRPVSHPQRSEWHEENSATGHFIYYDPDLEMGTADLSVSGPKRDHIHVILLALFPSTELTNSVGSLEVKILRSASFAPLPDMHLRVPVLFLSATVF